MERLLRFVDGVGEVENENVEQLVGLGILGKVGGRHEELWDPTLGLIVGRLLLDLQLWDPLVFPLSLSTHGSLDS